MWRKFLSLLDVEIGSMSWWEKVFMVMGFLVRRFFLGWWDILHQLRAIEKQQAALLKELENLGCRHNDLYKRHLLRHPSDERREGNEEC